MHLYLHLLLFFSGVLFALAMLAWSHRKLSVGAGVLFVFLAAEGGTCLAYALNVLSSGLEAKLFWNHAEYFFGLGVAPLLPVLALRVAGYRQRLPLWAWLALFAVPVAGVALNWTCRLHTWHYARIWLEPLGDITLLVKSRGPLYLVFFAYLYGLILVAAGLVAWRQVWHGAGLGRRQLWLIGVALAAPLVFGTPYYWMKVLWLKQVNTLHIGFCVTALAFSLSLLRGQALGLARALGEAQEWNELLLANANAIFYTIAPDGRFSYVSDSWKAFLGHRSDEMVWRDYREVVLAEDVPACDAFLAEVVRSGELRSGIEYRVRHKDGSVLWHTSSIKPVLDNTGKPITFVGVAHDITGVKQTQEALCEANERLRHLIASREAELREAVAGALQASEGEARRIGHEIHDGLCQELVALMRMAERFAQRLGEGDERRAAQGLAQQAAHALGLARNVSYMLTLHDLETLPLCEALSLFARRFSAATGVEIELNCSQARCACIEQAAEHVYRIVREAVVNAVRHGQAQRIWIDVIQEPQQAVVSVTNDGRPLPESEALKEGVGIKQMRMRTQQVGGTFSLKRDDQGKTVATLTVPCPEGETTHDEA
jgi:PAS domain S-box-containing protein